MIFLPLLTGLAFAAFSVAQADPTESAEGWFLAITATVLLAATGVAARADGTRHGAHRKGWTSAVALLSLLAFYFLHQGPQRGGVVLAVLVVGLLGGLAWSWRGLGRDGSYGASTTQRLRLPWRSALPWSLAATFGVQATSDAEAVLRVGAELRALVVDAVPAPDGVGGALLDLTFWPALAGLSLGVLAVLLGRLGLVLGCGHLLLFPHLDPLPVTALAVAAAGVGAAFYWLRRRDGAQDGARDMARADGLRAGPGVRRVLDAYAFLLLLLALPVLLLAAYPWQRPSPWQELPGLFTPPQTAAVALAHGPVVLTPKAPRHRVDLEEVAHARTVVLDSVLVHGAALSGETVAHVRILDQDGHLVGRAPVVAGEHTADWAAGRVDVASRPGFHAPAPWVRSVAPSGLFFAHRFRAVFARGPRYLERNGPDPVAALEIVRAPHLPAETQVHIHRLEIR